MQAASAMSRNLASEQHRAPGFRQTLDTFIGSAARLASRTQATAQDPAAWARLFAASRQYSGQQHGPGTSRDPDPPRPSPAVPDRARSRRKTSPPGQRRPGYTPGIGPRAAATPETGRVPPRASPLVPPGRNPERPR